MNFECFGPFLLDWYKLPETRWQKAFWDSVHSNMELSDISTARGCYVFCMEYNGKFLPWYVGKANGEKGFKQEIFTDHKYYIYEEMIEKKPKHKPHIMFFPLMTENNGFSGGKITGANHIDWLESTLIGKAYEVNPKLKNIAKLKYPKNMYVNGIIDKYKDSQRTEASLTAKQMFNKAKK